MRNMEVHIGRWNEKGEKETLDATKLAAERRALIGKIERRGVRIEELTKEAISFGRRLQWVEDSLEALDRKVRRRTPPAKKQRRPR